MNIMYTWQSNSRRGFEFKVVTFAQCEKTYHVGLVIWPVKILPEMTSCA